MKKTRIIYALLPVALLLSGCNKQELNPDIPEVDGKLSINVVESGFKAVFDETASATKWTATDKFGIFHQYGYEKESSVVYAANDTQQSFKIKEIKEDATTIESEDTFVWAEPMDGTTVTGYRFRLYYPYDSKTTGIASVSGTLPGSQAYDMEAESWDVSKYDFMYSDPVDIVTKESEIAFGELNHAFSILRVELNNDGKKAYEVTSATLESEAGKTIAGGFAADLGDGKLTFTNSLSAITTTVSNGSIESGEKKSLRFMLNASGIEGTVLRLTVTAGDGSVKQVRFVGKDIQAGAMAAKPVDVSSLKNIWCDIEGKGQVLFTTEDIADEGKPLEKRQAYWKTIGQIYSDNAPTVWAEFVQNPSNTGFANQPVFSFGKKANQAFVIKSIFTGDALLFHIPAKSIVTSKYLSFSANGYISGTAGAYYLVEYSADGGTTWKMADTGMEVKKSNSPLKADSNYYFLDADGKEAKDNKALEVKCSFDSEIKEQEVLLRLTCVDGTITPNYWKEGETYEKYLTEPAASEFSLGGPKDGKGIAISLQPKTVVESYYDFTNGSVLFKTNDAGSSYDALEKRQTEWKSSGKLNADNTSCVWAEYVQNADNKTIVTPEFNFEASARPLTVKGVYTDDAVLFHVPVKSAAVGKSIVVEGAINITGTAPLHYMMEYSEDGGSSWTAADTGNEVISTNNKGAASNFHFEKKGTSAFKAVCAVKAAISEKEWQFRIRCVDGTFTQNSKDPALPSTSFSFKLGNDKTEGILIGLE
ncbi:MAG: fimbrillin family protein [Bacteroidales bacterium]|nr:fimbrillin family protein [Bacteroidales bacterium]